MSEPITVTVENLTEAEAMALAQFVKRIGWKEWRMNAVSIDETDLMSTACTKLQTALAEAGFAPR